MLGETFELDRFQDMGLRSLCEQVRPAGRGWGWAASTLSGQSL
jgi:hypothetical protein